MFKKTLIEQFEDTCKVHSDKVALLSDSEEVSYSNLNNRVLGVATRLYTKGVKPGDRVTLIVDNSIEYVVLFYAVWKLGAVVVALNAHAKFHELKKHIIQCQSKCLLIKELDMRDNDALVKTGVEVITIGEILNTGTDIENVKKDEFECKVDATALAQIIYTSGTTGDPKGVMLSHGNLIANTLDIIKYLKLSDKDSIINVLPFHYSYGNSVLHTHLSVGATIVLKSSMAYPQDVLNDMRKYQTTGFSGVPSTYALLLSHSDWISSPPKLRYITQAGGPMGKRLTEEVLQTKDINTELFIMYGQTEASARISWLPPSELIRKTGSVGVAVDHVSVEIHDKSGNRLSAFEKGEVCVSGESVMQGYWENPQATNRVLRDGWLKTGDIGYVDEDGYIFLEGRNSDIIKVGAHRINPLELEEVINKLDFIRECAVTGIDDEILGQKLQVHIVGKESNSNRLLYKKHCSEYFPAHKIPRDIKWVTFLPKTDSGKIKRHKLNEQLEELK